MSDRDFPKYISKEQFQTILDSLNKKTKTLFVSNVVYKNKIKELESVIEADKLKITYLESKVASLEATLLEIKTKHLIPEDDFDPDSYQQESEEEDGE